MLLLPQPHGELLWPPLHPAKHKRSCSSPAAPRPCCHIALCPGGFEEHQCKLLSPRPGHSQHSLAFPTEDPAVCHKSWKVSAFLPKSPVCGQKLKGSGLYLVVGEKENRTTTTEQLSPKLQPTAPCNRNPSYALKHLLNHCAAQQKTLTNLSEYSHFTPFLLPDQTKMLIQWWDCNSPDKAALWYSRVS